MPVIDLHDANVDDPVTGKMKSPTHCGTAYVDYEYQAEQHVIDAETDYPHIVRIVVDDGRREWLRVYGKFVERGGSQAGIVATNGQRRFAMRRRAVNRAKLFLSGAGGEPPVARWPLDTAIAMPSGPRTRRQTPVHAQSRGRASLSCAARDGGTDAG